MRQWHRRHLTRVRVLNDGNGLKAITEPRKATVHEAETTL